MTEISDAERHKISALLIDDEAEDRNQIGTLLRTRGIKVEVTSSGEAALELLGRRHFDVLVTDAILKGMNSLEFVQRARRLRAGTCVVGITGAVGPFPIVENLRYSAEYFLQKPSYDDESEVEDFADRILESALHCHNLRDALIGKFGLEDETEKLGDEIDHSLGTQLDANVMAFHEHRDEWREMYPGEFIAVVNGQLAGHDEDRFALAKRMFEEHKGKHIFIGNPTSDDDGEPLLLSGGTYTTS